MVGINTNLISGSAQRNLGAANNVVSSSVARLSSGNRIIKASDDVAGLAIGTALRSTLSTLQVALLNTQQATSVLSIADGALAQVGDILNRQQSIASQANSGSLGTTERGFLNQEFQALISEIDRIVTSTQFNGITLLNGSLGSSAGKDLLVPTGSTTPTVANTYTYGGVGHSALTNTSEIAFSGTFDPNLIGSLEDAVFSVTSNAANNVTYTLQIGNSIYVGNDSNTNSGGTIALTNASTGSIITLGIATQGVANQAQANTLQDAIQADLEGGTIYQTRFFATTTSGLAASNTEGTILDGLDGASVSFKTSSLTSNTAPVVGAVSVTAETGTSDGSVSLTLGGVTYTTAAGEFDSDGGNIEADTLDGGTGTLRLYKNGDATTNPNDYIDIDLTDATTTGIDIDSDGAAQLLETALNSLFGVGNNGALSFQVGGSVTDTIAVSISSVKTTDIYVDDDGVGQTLDITTQAGAQLASEVIGNAISTVIGRRADVGAAISRFNFAASNLEVSISNQDAARGSFLDADVATESTNFATAQVKLQASVAVLAQSNQLPAVLLKLLNA